MRTKSLFLARVEATVPLAEAICELDLVAHADLPPRLPNDFDRIFGSLPPLHSHSQPTGQEPLVAVLDSGILPVHPLLREWVADEVDFDSGESMSVD